MNNIYYKNKYLKYKNKYIQLRAIQKGGTWGCTKCTFNNEHSDDRCEICEEPNPDPKILTTWNCSRCTFKNKKMDNKCIMCENTPSSTMATSITASPATYATNITPSPATSATSITASPATSATSITASPATYATSTTASPATSATSKKFYIYTTGIADWGDKETIAAKWNNNVCANILYQIPSRFNDIHIIHSDILKPMDEFDNMINEEERGIILETFNQLLSINDLMKPRVKKSSFTLMPIDFNTLETPHIVIDMAHLFIYNKTGLVTIGHTMPSYNIKSIYLGYFGDQVFTIKANQMYDYNIYIASRTQYFKVNDDDSIITYIDRLIHLKYDYNPDDPSNFFNTFLQKLTFDVEDAWLGKGNKLDSKSSSLINTIIYDQLPLLVRKIMNEKLSIEALHAELLSISLLRINATS